jgi:hypothetical protein
MSGFLVLTYMRWWNGKEVVRANGKVGIELKSIYNTVSLTFSAVLMCNPCAGWLHPTEQSGCTHAFVQGKRV